MTGYQDYFSNLTRDINGAPPPLLKKHMLKQVYRLLRHLLQKQKVLLNKEFKCQVYVLLS